jgi:hypothetical protein
VGGAREGVTVVRCRKHFSGIIWMRYFILSAQTSTRNPTKRYHSPLTNGCGILYNLMLPVRQLGNGPLNRC